MKYFEAIKHGKEIVIISSEEKCYSCIFWMNDGIFYSFTRSFGVMKRTDMTGKRFTDHIKNMLSENAKIYIRG